jgi:tripartite-type tricarboxylate transporter receptor subunit TctC
MLIRRIAGTLLPGMMMAAGIASGQNYPDKSIRLLVPPPGGSTEFTSRLLADAVAASLGQRFVIESRAGQLGAEIAAQAPADGYTALHFTNLIWLMPLFRKVAWDPVRDFAPVAMTIVTPNIVVVHPSLPAKSIKELIALAKARPGELNYGSGSTGAANHVAAELFKSMAGVNLVRINYKGAGTAIIDLVAGQVQVMFATAGSVTHHIKSGRLRALAVTSAEPSALTPGLVTVAAAGLPGYESASMSAMFVPAKTPAGIIQRLNHEVVQGLNKPEVKDRLFAAGIQVVGSTPDEAAAKIKSEVARMGKVIREAGLRE